MSLAGATCIKRQEDESKATPEHIRLYQSFIGSLMYLMLGTRPDIAYAVGRLARFAHDPSKEHFRAVLCLFSYVSMTTKFTIQYTQTNHEEQDSYFPYGTSDADLGGELSTNIRRKSTSGVMFIMAMGPISWSSKLQKTIATSMMEAEYIALYAAGKQAAWIQNVYEAIGDQMKKRNTSTSSFTTLKNSLKGTRLKCCTLYLKKMKLMFLLNV